MSDWRQRRRDKRQRRTCERCGAALRLDSREVARYCARPATCRQAAYRDRKRAG